MASFAEETFTHDNLIVQPGTHDLPVTLQSGQNLSRGAVLGELKFAPGAPVAGGGDTGDGTVTVLQARKKSLVGNYLITCIVAVTNAGVFKVETPDGDQLEEATVGVSYDNDFLSFLINDGSADFIVGDSFTLPINAHADAGERKLAVAAAIDGSQVAESVLAVDTDASAAAVLTQAFDEGKFNERALSFGAGHTATTVKADFAEFRVDIHLHDSVQQ